MKSISNAATFRAVTLMIGYEPNTNSMVALRKNPSPRLEKAISHEHPVGTFCWERSSHVFFHFTDRSADMRDKRSMGAVMGLWLSTMACLLVTTLCLFSFANAQASAGGVLTLDDAILLAKSNNRDLKLFGFDVGKEREALSEVKTHLYPRFDTSVLAAELLAPLDFTIKKGQFGTYAGTGPIPGSNTDLHTPARPIAIASVTATQPLTQLLRIHLSIAGQRLKADAAQLSFDQREQKLAAHGPAFQPTRRTRS
jgi:hypothetical protein